EDPDRLLHRGIVLRCGEVQARAVILLRAPGDRGKLEHPEAGRGQGEGPGTPALHVASPTSQVQPADSRTSPTPAMLQQAPGRQRPTFCLVRRLGAGTCLPGL